MKAWKVTQGHCRSVCVLLLILLWLVLSLILCAYASIKDPFLWSSVYHWHYKHPQIVAAVNKMPFEAKEHKIILFKNANTKINNVLFCIVISLLHFLRQNFFVWYFITPFPMRKIKLVMSNNQLASLKMCNFLYIK